MTARGSSVPSLLACGGWTAAVAQRLQLPRFQAEGVLSLVPPAGAAGGWDFSATWVAGSRRRPGRGLEWVVQVVPLLATELCEMEAPGVMLIVLTCECRACRCCFNVCRLGMYAH